MDRLCVFQVLLRLLRIAFRLDEVCLDIVEDFALLLDKLSQLLKQLEELVDGLFEPEDRPVLFLDV